MSKRSFGRRDNPIHLDDYDYDNDSVEMKYRLAEERAEAQVMAAKANDNDSNAPHITTSSAKRPRPPDEDTQKPCSSHTGNSSSSNTTNEHESSTTSSPIKLFATLQDEQIRRQASNENHHHRLEYCWTLREMLGLDVHPHDSLHKEKTLPKNNLHDPTATAKITSTPSSTTTPSIDWILISNYIIDFDVLVEEVPELVSFPHVVIVYGHADTEPPPPSAWAYPNAVDVICRRPGDTPRSPNNPLSYRIPYGVHHSKLFLIGYSNGTLRVIIHTANLRYNDIHLKTQGAFVQDFYLKTPTHSKGAATTTDFEDALVSYIGTYGYTKSRVWDAPATASSSATSSHPPARPCTLTQLLRRYDFSTARAILLPSTPGYHPVGADTNKNDTCQVGHLRLRSALAVNGNSGGAKTTTPNARSKPTGASSIICQFSSMGSLTEAWLRELELSMDVTALAKKQHAATTSNRPLKLKFVYPTVEEIRTSVEGYRGGGSVPGSTKNIGKPFLGSLYHKWGSSSNSTKSTTANSETHDIFQRSHNVPHIKTYYQLTPDRYGMEWFVLTSHNMSKAAWGEVIRSRQHGNEKRLFIRHWELGVLIKGGGQQNMHLRTPAATTAAEEQRSSIPSDTDRTDPGSTIRIPLPYQLCPEPYTFSDRPWAVDGVYSVPDAFGQLGC